jgi:hypothetical protein
VLRIWEAAVPVLFSLHALCTCIFPSNEFQCCISSLPHFRVTSLLMGWEFLFICPQISSPKICQISNHWMQNLGCRPLSVNNAWRIDIKRFLLVVTSYFFCLFQYNGFTEIFIVNFQVACFPISVVLTFAKVTSCLLFLILSVLCFSPFFPTHSNKYSGKTPAVL